MWHFETLRILAPFPSMDDCFLNKTIVLNLFLKRISACAKLRTATKKVIVSLNENNLFAMTRGRTRQTVNRLSDYWIPVVS